MANSTFRNDAARSLAFAGAARLQLGTLLLTGIWALCLASGPAQAAPAKLTADQILAKHIAARGGLATWHGVQTMAWTGKMEVGYGDSIQRSAQYAGMTAPRKKSEAVAASVDTKVATVQKQVQLPFVLEMKRPTLSRVEVVFAGKTAVQVYDGKTGWKVRPYLNRNDAEPFTAEEIKASAGQWDMDGPLLDAAAKGTRVEVDGTEAIDGHDAYRLKLTAKNGDVRHIWIDAKSFLDVKVEGAPRRMDGKMRSVYTVQRDFHAVQGLMVPFVLETSVDGYADMHKMLIEKVSLNPVLRADLFAKPGPGGV